MLLPKVGYVQAFTIASLLICGVSLISLCIWRPGLLRRTFFGRRSKQNRFRKPKRRVDNADYNKLQQNVPEEEALESEAEELTQSRRKYPDIVINALNHIAKGNRNISKPENSSETLIMTRNKNGSNKEKKERKKKNKGEVSHKVGGNKKHKKSSPWCGASNVDHSDDEDREIPTNVSKSETGATNLNNDLYDIVGERDLYKESTEEKIDSMHRDVSRRPGQPGGQKCIPANYREHRRTKNDKGLLKQSTVTVERYSVFGRSSEEETDGFCKAGSKAGTKMRTDDKQCINCTENKQYSEIRETQKIRPTGNYENLPIAVNGNLDIKKQMEHEKWDISTESSKKNNLREITDLPDLKQEIEISSICNGDNVLEPNLGKHERTMIDCEYENLQKPPVYVDGEEKLSNPIKSLNENFYQKIDVNLSATLESVTVPLYIDEYATKEWRGETIKAAQIRRGYSKVKEETGLICIRRIRGDNYCALRAVLFRTLSSGIDILGRFSKIMEIEELPSHLLDNNCMWLNNWNFANRLQLLTSSVLDTLISCLNLLANIVRESISCLDDSKRYKMILNIMNKNEEDEVKLFEAVKFLMLYSSVQLYEKMQNGEDVDLLGALLFARDTSQDPESFMKNHLNCVGDVAGLDQLEMMLLGQTLNVVIKVFRLHRVDKDDFTVEFPNDLNNQEGTIELVAEDDRHYNVLSEEA